MMETINLIPMFPYLLLVALRPGSFGFSVTAIALFSEALLSLRGAPTIEMTGLTVNTVMHFWDSPTVVIALDVLPCFATLAEHCVPIVIFERTYTFDGIRLLLVGLCRIRDSAVDDG